MELSQEKKIIDLYNSGQTMNSIAKEFHTYATTIKRILEKHKVELRHDCRKKGELSVKDGEKLIEWAKAQGRLVTKTELANLIGTKKLSPSYFIKYPELGQYVKVPTKNSYEYTEKLYQWLQKNNIPYKPDDRTTLKGFSVDALLLGKYSNLAIQISERPRNVSSKIHYFKMGQKLAKAKEVGIDIVFLNKEHFENLDDVKVILDELKH